MKESALFVADVKTLMARFPLFLLYPFICRAHVLREVR